MTPHVPAHSRNTAGVALDIPFFVPDITEREIESVVEALRSGWLTSGPRMAEFERRFAERVKTEHALAVNSCTAALHLALVASGIGPGDEVIVPTMTFAATAAVVIHSGAEPVLVDVDPSTLLVEAEAVERAIGPRTKAVIPVHYGGQPCDMGPLMQLAADHGLRVIEDAAHAFPASYRGTPIGNIGDATCFSFYATKTITTGEGGMLTTRDGSLADRASVLRLHGLSRDAWRRLSSPASWAYDILEPGFKDNLTDLAASLGLAQLERADDMRSRRSELAGLYTSLLAQVPGVHPLGAKPDRTHAWHLFAILLDVDELGVDRDTVICRMEEQGVGCSVHYRPLHMHSYYRKTYGYRDSDFPHAARAFDRLVSLPLYSRMRPDHVERVVEALRTSLGTKR